MQKLGGWPMAISAQITVRHNVPHKRFSQPYHIPPRPTTDGDDALRVALHPGNRAEGTDKRAFEWDISASAPGGGSGRHTLYRPPARNGGLPSGQLAKDSSVYELAVKREGDITAYELRIPWSETGGRTPAVGTRAGLSLQLFDADNNGLAPSVMTWGGGLLPEWAPSAFGLLTLID